MDVERQPDLATAARVLAVQDDLVTIESAGGDDAAR